MLPGGLAEIFTARPGRDAIVWRQRRGLCRLSLETGARLIPMYVFGGNDFFHQGFTSEGSLSYTSHPEPPPARASSAPPQRATASLPPTPTHPTTAPPKPPPLPCPPTTRLTPPPTPPQEPPPPFPPIEGWLCRASRQLGVSVTAFWGWGFMPVPLVPPHGLTLVLAEPLPSRRCEVILEFKTWRVFHVLSQKVSRLPRVVSKSVASSTFCLKKCRVFHLLSQKVSRLPPFVSKSITFSTFCLKKCRVFHLLSQNVSHLPPFGSHLSPPQGRRSDGCRGGRGAQGV